MAEDPATETGLEVAVETEGNPDAAADAKTSTAEMAAYFDEIFGKFGHWFAYAFSDNRPIESGNLSASMPFMNGDRASFLGDQNGPSGRTPSGGGSQTENPPKPPLDFDLPDDDGPRIEIKSVKARNFTAEGIFNDSFFQHSNAAIDQHFMENVLRRDVISAPVSNRPATQRSKMSVKAFRSLPASDSPAASFAIQAVPEPSSILFCGFASMILAWHRRRPDSR
ncbi:MAG: hypothetical protein V4689_00390 [Verrucomicrobiota bacterium]